MVARELKGPRRLIGEDRSHQVGDLRADDLSASGMSRIVMIEVMAVVIPDIQDTLRRDAYPLIGKDLVGAHHLDQWHTGRTERHGRSEQLRNASFATVLRVVRRNSFVYRRNTQAPCHVHHVIHAGKLECFYRGYIERICNIETDAGVQVVVPTTIIHGMVSIMLGIGLPTSSRKIGLFIRQHQAWVPAHLKSSCVDNWLEGRTWLAIGDGSIEISTDLTIMRIPVGTAVHCQYLTRFGIHHDHRGVVDIMYFVEGSIIADERLVFRLIKMTAHGILNKGFQVDIDGRIYIEAAIEQCLCPYLGFQLLNDPVHKMRSADMTCKARVLLSGPSVGS